MTFTPIYTMVRPVPFCAHTANQNGLQTVIPVAFTLYLPHSLIVKTGH